MATSSRLAPLIVASPLFLQNVDSTAMALALPSIAAALGLPLLDLNVVITAYALSLAVFLPASAWLADRFGAKKVFCWAIVLFSLASSLCGLADSLAMLVLCRVLQGCGGAMMVPVGRLLLLRSAAPSELVGAMVWFTVPPLIGRLAGPLIGGAIVSLASWQWIFFVNIPFGLAVLLLALWKIDDRTGHAAVGRFDVGGFGLLAFGLAMLLGGLSALGGETPSGWMPPLATLLGALALYAYVRSSRRKAEPLIDLSILRYRTLRTNVLGAAPFRLGLFAVPFLLPLLLQVGFALSPIDAGSVVSASAVGALCTRLVTQRAVRRFGFRTLLLGATSVTAVIWAGFALLEPGSPRILMLVLIFAGGLASSLCMVLLNTLGYTEVPHNRTSHATALTTMAQQLMAACAVVLATAMLSLFSWYGGAAGLGSGDFAGAFLAIGMIALVSLPAYRRLSQTEGAQLR